MLTGRGGRVARRLRVRHALSLAVSAVRCCSAAARPGRARGLGSAWREMHDAGVGHAHSGGPLRLPYIRVELEVFRTGEDITTCHLVEHRGLAQIRIGRGPAVVVVW